MQLKDLKHLIQDNLIELLIKDDKISSLNLEDELTLHRMDDGFMLKQHSTLLEVDNPKVLDGFSNIDNFIWVPLKIINQNVIFGVIPCIFNELGFESISAAVDEAIIEQVIKISNKKALTVEDVAKWLMEEFVLQQGNTNYVLFANGKNDKQSSIYTVVGKSNLMQLEFTKENTFWIKSVKKLSRNAKFNLTRCEVNIAFVDHTVAAKITDPLMKAKLEELNKDNSTYINLWDQYNEKVKEKAVGQAKDAGFVRYVKLDMYESVDGIKWKFYFQDKDKDKVKTLCLALKESNDPTLEINKVLPEWLENNIGDISQEKEEKKPSIKATFVDSNEQCITLHLSSRGKPESRGVIYLSISGSMVQMQRRETARDAITKLTNPMKDLRFLIEDRDISVSQGRRTHKKLKPLTPASRSSFKGEPTGKQIEALDVALNTPDIALILGPPGTGKTQVISALQNRLAEEHKSNLTGQILLTSFQNDAVDNVIARSEAFGIPAIRADDAIRAPFLLEQWGEKQSQHFNKVLNELTDTEGSYKIIKNIRKDIAAIFDSRVEKKQKQARVSSLLEDVEHLKIHHGFEVPFALLDNIRESFLVGKSTPIIAENTELLKQVRGLRTTQKSFLDDGFEQSFICLQAIKRTNKYPEAVTYLSSLIEHDSVEQQELDQLREIKNALLDNLIPDCRPNSLQAQISQEDVKNLNQLEELISVKEMNSPAGIPDVIEDYLDTIKYQPAYLANGIQQYTTSIGASCQRSAGEQVVNFKNDMNSALSEVTTEHQFDTVIVDEAARANPLDLFIPMALASRRIVLVGDHFQLPQMLEPDIENEMLEKGTLDQQTANAIKMSLFERLYTQLKAREKKDGIQRTVMLDTQFRMDPELGNFISKTFYESQGEQKILSGLKRPSFDLGIPKYRDKVAEWVDTPISFGSEKRAGTSWMRECEAIKVVEEVKSLLAEEPDLSIGVITFFAAQRELILTKLSLEGICQKSKDGWEYSPGYKTTKDGQEKLRVGSVDAFQGKEFDVVILSTVRSNHFPCNDENSYRIKYGFIRTPNRLNVAFSRAKSLIKVVGDKAMFSSESAKEAIPQIHIFYQDLCEVR